MDSNHRKRKLADLQSAPFGHSGTPPLIISIPFSETSLFTLSLNWSAKLYPFFILSNS